MVKPVARRVALSDAFPCRTGFPISSCPSGREASWWNAGHGVNCVKLLLPWNVGDTEKLQYCERIGRVVSDAGRWHMPVMIEPVFPAAPRTREIIAKELEVARIGYDLGADIIKITFPAPTRRRRCAPSRTFRSSSPGGR
jgi:hypothetical protein